MLTRILFVVGLVVVSAGCGLRAHTYVMDKELVGIEKGSGNAGYLSGTPQYVEPTKKTRRVYVLEITKALREGEVKKIQQETTMTTKSTVEVPAAVPAVQEPAHATHKIVIPPIEDEPASAVETEHPAPTGPTEAITYTVQKDDTLQKIAKKYYGSYAAWLKIYNANKEKIKNPNLVKPGTVITLPAAK